MQTQLISKPQYNGQAVTFDFTAGDGLINATQMAKIFDQDPNEFLRLPSTERFIEALLKEQNQRLKEQAIAEAQQLATSEDAGFIPGKSRNENAKFTREDIVKTERGGRNSGTWMNRLLAIKFAAWLDPEFEIWVFRVIDNLTFGDVLANQQRLHEVAIKEKRRLELEKQFGQNDEYRELQSLRASKQIFLNAPKKAAQQQLALFVTPPSVEE